MAVSLQPITFQVPASYSIPPLYQTLDAEGIATAITLGAQAYILMTKEGQKLCHTTLFQQLQAQAVSEYEPKLELLQKQLTKSNETSATLKKHLQEEEERRRQVEQQIREEERRNREELLKEKNSRIQSLEQQVHTHFQGVEQTMKENNRTLQDSIQSFKESFLKTTTGSKKKGDHGEMLFQTIVQNAFGSVSCRERFVLESVGTEGRQGDLHMTWNNHKLLMEVKNYTRSVDDKEVKKFLRDMEQGRDMSIGILVSLNTGIVGHSKTGCIDIEELRDGRYCIYISNLFEQQDPVQFLQSLKPFLETFLLLREKQLAIQTGSSEESEAETEANAKVERFELQRTMLLKLLQNHQENTRNFKNTIQNAKKKQEQIWIELGVDMLKAEHDVKLLLETLLDVHSIQPQSTDVQESITLPSYMFYKTDISLYNEKERLFLKDLLTQYTFEEDAVCQKKELKDSMKLLGYSDEIVNKYCERFCLDSVWEKGKKTVKHMKRIV